jgi:hypothetical protein
MTKIFTRTFRVRWAELDASSAVSPANYLRYLMETAWDWGDAVGLGVNDSQTLDLFWVIRETEIRSSTLPFGWSTGRGSVARVVLSSNSKMAVM